MILDPIFAATAGLQIPGGCDHCDAYQTTSLVPGFCCQQ